jgi:AraC-like DNA-binding protein
VVDGYAFATDGNILAKRLHRDAGGLHGALDRPAHMICSLMERLAALGFQAEHVLVGTELAGIDFTDPACRLSLRQSGRIIRRAIELVPDRPLGLEVGASETIASIGLVGYAMLTSPTLVDAVTIGVSMQRQAGALMHLDCVEAGEGVTIYADNAFLEADIEIFLAEEVMSACQRLCVAVLGEDFCPDLIEFPYPRPPHATLYEDFFRCPIRFDSARAAFHVGREQARRKVPTHDRLAHRQALDLLNVSTAAPLAVERELVPQIERIILENILHPPKLPDVARQLNFSERSLRRRLAERGCSYQELMDVVRQKRACVLLRDAPDCPIERIAEQVGFSDSHNFRRAFRRWTGWSPQTWRAQFAGAEQAECAE